MQFITHRKRKVIINITSLVDVLFLLLIFFIVSSTFLEQPGIRLNLPSTSNLQTHKRVSYILYIDYKRRIYINKHRVDLTSLSDSLKSISNKIEGEGLMIEADERIEYGFFVRVIDILRQCGIDNLVITTKFEKFDQRDSSGRLK